ncbi:MAG: pyruvate kinase alpha/beta domain-containing protein [Syntrophomonadales bacterium]|jgi:hypothetical protein
MFWEKSGPENTENTINLAIKRGQELGLRHIVVASCSGDTARKLIDRGFDLTCVTHHVGFSGPGQDEMPAETRQELSSLGAKVLTSTHLLAGVDRAVRNHFGGVYPAEIIAQTLRMFGQGVKVAIEIATMAKDAGMIPHDTEVISIAGTVSGADSAIVVMPAHSNHFWDTQVREIICMPRVKK